MVFIEIDNVMVELDDRGDFSLRDISRYSKFEFEDLFKKFAKDFITKKELHDFIGRDKESIDEKFTGMIIEKIHNEFNNNVIEELQKKNDILLSNIKELEDKLKKIELCDKKTQKEDGYIYVATSKIYCEQSLFKVGKTSNLRNRLPTYNTGKVGEDRFYYCYYRWVPNMRYAEENIHSLLQDFRDSKRNEFFKIPFKCLKETIDSIIDKIDQGDTVENLNEFIKLLREDLANKKRNGEFERLRDRIAPEKTIGETGELSDLHFIEAISKLLNQYGEQNRLTITRDQLFEDVSKELKTKDWGRQYVWELFKKHFKRNSMSNVIRHGDYQITIKYYAGKK